MSVKITYECEETGQIMTAIFEDGVELDTVDIKINFEPEASDETKDPYGVLGRILRAIGGE